ncbi:NAD(P)/FAD-dependent oxidoreductase [Sphingomonas sp. RS2018]
MPPLTLGAGPAGCAAAITLARAGVRATMLERSREDEDALCGGFLSWRTLATLESLGIAADSLNPAPVTRVRLFAGERRAESRLPAPARAVSRRRLDAIMRAQVGDGIERGVTVRAVEDGHVRLGDGATLTPETLILATGKHDVRGVGRPHDVSDPAIGLRLRLAASPTLTRLVADAVELHLFDGGYAGLALQEDGSANLCLALRRSRMTAAGGPAALLDRLSCDHPHLGERIGRIAAGAAIDAVANVPYGWRARDSDGPYRVGDQAAVIPSLAGEGMGIAIATGILAAQAIIAGVPPRDYQHRIATAALRPLAVAGAIRHVAEAPPLAAPLLALALPPLVRAVARATRFPLFTIR